MAAVAEDYQRALRDGFSVELWFLYSAPAKENIQRAVDVYNKNAENVENGRAIRHLSLDQIRTEWIELTEHAGRRVPSETINLASSSTMTFSGSFGEAVVVSVPGSELRRLYNAHRDLLFERNVRLFLGTRKGSVNAAIAETIEDIRSRANFWAYNNGITIICDSFTLDGVNLKVEQFNIINGCQTTVSLARSDSELDAISVLARLIKAPRDIIDDIVKYNNSQNPIKVWDIASQNKTQRRLKVDFERLSTPWIYLTRRGSRPTTGLKKFRDAAGKLRLIEFEEAGQHTAAYRGRPVLAYKDKALIFTRFHEDLFPKDIRVEDVLFHHICGLVTRQLTLREIARGDAEDNRILKKGGALFVLATMAVIIEQRNGAAFLSRMDASSIMSKRLAGRLEKYAEFALNQYIQSAKDEMNISQQEYTTLVRSADFFEKAKARIVRNFRQLALSVKWLDDALPKLGLS